VGLVPVVPHADRHSDISPAHVPARSWASVNDTPAANTLTSTLTPTGSRIVLLDELQHIGAVVIINDHALHLRPLPSG